MNKAFETKYNDLLVQSMLFDMDIDIETLTLTPKASQDETPVWLTRWKEKEHGGDRQPSDYQGWN